MDSIQRFLFEQASVRGELAQLKQSYQDVLAAQDYPASVQVLLGEMMVAASLLVDTIKIEGELTLQVQGKGKVDYAVISANHQQELKGIARWRADPGDANFAEMFKGGIFTITISPTLGQRYQGIVAIDKPTLAECLEGYFEQSEQLPTKIELRVAPKTCAAGLFLQVVPSSAESSVSKANEEFLHLATLAESIQTDELTQLSVEQILHRLYHQEEVRVFEPQGVVFKCSCSKEKSASALKSIDKNELLDIIKSEGAIKMNCQFCHAEYQYDEMDVATIHAGFNPTEQKLQ